MAAVAGGPGGGGGGIGGSGVGDGKGGNGGDKDSYFEGLSEEEWLKKKLAEKKESLFQTNTE